MSGWPDPARPGVPLNPERDGWHWVQHHLSPAEELPLVRYWDAAEHDWPEYFEHSETYVATRYRYLGPCLTPAELAAREAAAFKRGAEAAAQEVDCACDIRSAVLERLESQGHKRASYLCSRGDTCCALAAAAIRALPVPEDHNEQD